MNAIAFAAADELLAEARSIRTLTGATDPITEHAAYLGATDHVVDATSQRSHSIREGGL